MNFAKQFAFIIVGATVASAIWWAAVMPGNDSKFFAWTAGIALVCYLSWAVTEDWDR
jgi:hypothetical protein